MEKIEHQLDDHQPKEQHGFRRGKRIEQHLLVGIPALFAIRKWRLKVGDFGFTFLHGMPNVTDLQVADNILPFAQLAIEKGKLLDSLVAELSEVGFVLNADTNGLFDKLNLTAFNNHDGSWNCMANSARQRKRRRRTRPTKRFWSTRAFLCRNVSSILILLFHPLRALQVDVVPCTTNTHKPWT